MPSPVGFIRTRWSMPSAVWIACITAAKSSPAPAVLNADPGMGVFRHVDASYKERPDFQKRLMLKFYVD